MKNKKIYYPILTTFLLVFTFFIVLAPSALGAACDSSLSALPCEINGTLTLGGGVYNVNSTLWLNDNDKIIGNGSTIITSISAPFRLNGTNNEISDLTINGSVNGATLIYSPAVNGVIKNVNCDVNLYCVRFFTGGDNFTIENINGEALIIANANDIYVNNYTMNADIVSSASSLAITDSTNVVIENSEFTGVDSFGDGFWVAGQTVNTNNITVRNNVFNNLTSIYSNEFGAPTTNVLLENNTFNAAVVLSSTDLVGENHVFYNNNFNAGVSFTRPLCDSSLSYIPCNINQNNLTINNGVYDFGNYKIPIEPAIILEDDSYIFGNGASIIIDNYDENVFIAYGELIKALGGGGITNLNLNASSAPLLLESQLNDETFYLNDSTIAMRGDISFGLSLIATNMRYLYIKNNTFIGRPSFETNQFFYGSEVSGNTFLTGATQASDNHVLMGLVGGGSSTSGLDFYNNNIEAGMNQRYTTTDFFSNTEDVNNVIEFRGTNDKYVIISYYDTTTKSYEQIRTESQFTTGVYYGEGFGTPINFDYNINTSYITMTRNSVNLEASSFMDAATLVFRDLNNRIAFPTNNFSEYYILLKDNIPYFNQNACAFDGGNVSVECGVSGYGEYIIIPKSNEEVFKDNFKVYNNFEDISSNNFNDYVNNNYFGNCGTVNNESINGRSGINIDSFLCSLSNYEDLEYLQNNFSYGFWLHNTNHSFPARIYQAGNLTSSSSNSSYFRISSFTASLTRYDSALSANSKSFNYNSYGEWVHYNFNYENGFTTIYVNGIETETSGLNHLPLSWNNNQIDKLKLGIAEFGNTNAKDVYIDDLYIYDGKLEQEAIFNIIAEGTNYIDTLNLSFTPAINITNISLETTILEFNEDLVGVCTANYTGSENLTYTYEWLINDVPAVNSFLIPNTPIQQSGVLSSGEVTNSYTFETASNNFNYTPTVNTFRSQSTCGINYRLELGDQIYQRSTGVFYVDYGITPYSSVGNFPFIINDTYIDNGNVTFNLTTRFACVLGGSYVRFTEEAQPVNSDTLNNALFNDGDNITFKCSVTAGELNTSSNTSEIITVNDAAPTTVTVNPLLLENLTSNETIYSEFLYLTLNSTGRNIEFSYSESVGSPQPIYNIYLTNGFINRTIRTGETNNNFIENITANDILISSDYNVVVEAINSEGNSVSLGSEIYTFCVNNWDQVRTECINDEQTLTYNDTNSCAEQYDIPANNGTVVACDDGILSDTEIEENNRNLRTLFVVLTALVVLSFIGGILTGSMRNNILALVMLFLGSLLSIYGIIAFNGTSFVTIHVVLAILNGVAIFFFGINYLSNGE